MFVFYAPTKVVFGEGAVEVVGDEVSKLGKKALIVTGRRSARESGLLQKILDSMKSSGVSAVVFDRVVPNPPIENVVEGSRIARREDVDVVVGVGGGSSLDAAKAIAAAAVLGEDIERYLFPNTVEKALPVVAVPTTCGTGSEVTRYSILTHLGRRKKVVLAGTALIPRTAVVDPTTLRTLTPNMVAWTAVDALSHAVEALLSRSSNPIAAMYAAEAVGLVFSNVVEAYREKSPDALSRLHLASLLAGVAINNCGTVLVHALGYYLTAWHGVHHGLANALYLPHVLYAVKNHDVVNSKLAPAMKRLGLGLSLIHI